MEIHILQASMNHSMEDGYIGKVEFEVSGHKQPYEIALHSKKGKEWSYGLFFLGQSGDEEQILQLEEWLEEDDETYMKLVNAAKSSLSQQD